MRCIKKVFVAIVFFLTILYPVNAKAAEYIDNFDISVKVHEDGVYTVTNKVEYTFDSLSHGMYATIPQRYEMNFGGETKEYYFPITNIQVKDYPFETESGDNVAIRIGDPDTYVSGTVLYEYSYDVRTRDLGLGGTNMFYFNLIGNGWSVPINNVDFKVEMPKAFNTKPLFYGVTEEAKSGKAEDVNYELNDEKTTITGFYDKTIDPGNALTVLIDLENGYFIYPDYTTTQIGLGGLVVLIVAILGVLFRIYGKDDKIIPVVNFYPPEGMSSLLIGYAADNAVQSKDITSLFIYWASKGYLKIEEKKDKKFNFIKVKDIDKSETQVEQSLFNALFIEEDTVSTDKMPEAYFNAKILVEHDLGKTYFIEDKQLRHTKATSIQIFAGLILAISIALFAAINTNNYYYDIFISMIIGAITFVMVLVLNGAYLVAFKNREVKNASTNNRNMIIVVILFIIISVIFLLFMSSIQVSLMYSLIVIAALVVGLGFVAFMDKRTDYATKLLGNIYGLREFIVQAQKDKLEMLVEKDPTYFYNILPYAYVLNVSDKWIKNFENINMVQPDWYLSTTPMNNILFYSMLNSSLNNLNTAANFMPNTSGKGTGGFSGGGGFGGGGFSGGGFGGGGGGSW
ncbi:DUF2207 domain-containing protein [Mycoplasma sp. P36-A1]|uniref:DUF2207 domain-containing protein n=1 Tax=Mycoplasma sp. P36-A1 TaxID=3252900 RepID=UPI003C2E0D27